MSLRFIFAALTALCLAQPARSQEVPPADPLRIWTFNHENDSVLTPFRDTDWYYTSGLRISVALGTNETPARVADFANAAWGPGRQRFLFSLSQQIFTPYDRGDVAPPGNDRPFAAVLLGTLGLQHDTMDSRTMIGLSVGVIGPAALGDQVQNGWHTLLGRWGYHVEGWGSQIANQPMVEFTASRTWRLPVSGGKLLEADLLPQTAIGLGNQRIYATAGMMARLGRGLQSDFGPSRMVPGLSGGDAFTPTRAFPWYLFAGVSGQAIAYDATLDGSRARSPYCPLSAQACPRYALTPLVGAFQAGFVVMVLQHVRVSFSDVWQTIEFPSQRPGWFNFASLAASVRF